MCAQALKHGQKLEINRKKEKRMGKGGLWEILSVVFLKVLWKIYNVLSLEWLCCLNPEEIDKRDVWKWTYEQHYCMDGYNEKWHIEEDQG